MGDPSCSGDPGLVVWVLRRWQSPGTTPDCLCPGTALRASPPPRSSPPRTWAAAGLWLVRRESIHRIKRTDMFHIDLQVLKMHYAWRPKSLPIALKLSEIISLWCLVDFSSFFFCWWVYFCGVATFLHPASSASTSVIDSLHFPECLEKEQGLVANLIWRTGVQKL